MLQVLSNCREQEYRELPVGWENASMFDYCREAPKQRKLVCPADAADAIENQWVGACSF